MQVDKVEGTKVYVKGKQIDVDINKRLTSAQICQFVLDILKDGEEKNVFEIKKEMDHRLVEGEFYTQGQVAGVLKNMQLRKEIECCRRGVYRTLSYPAENRFEVETTLYNGETQKSKTLGRLLSYYALLDNREKSGIYYEKNFASSISASPWKEQVLTTLEDKWGELDKVVDKVNVSQLSDSDFEFLREFREISKIVRGFIEKQKSDRCESDKEDV